MPTNLNTSTSLTTPLMLHALARNWWLLLLRGIAAVVTSPVVPRERSKPRPLQLAVLGFVLGGVIALIWVFVADYVAELPSTEKIRLYAARRTSR